MNIEIQERKPSFNRRAELLPMNPTMLNGNKSYFTRNFSLSGSERPAMKRNRLRDLKIYKNCVILPDDPWKMRWDLFLLFAIVFTSLVTPYNISFFQNESFEWLVAESIIDVIFFIDLIFSFFAAYYNEIEEVIDDRRKIACGYLRSWFFIDFISILPIQHFISNSSNVNSLGQLAKIPRFYRILKTLKIMRMTKIMEKRSLFQKKISRMLKTSTACDKSLTLASSFVLLWHLLSCLWFLVAKLQNFPENSWVIRYGYEEQSPGEQYLASLYFIITTITTVGYGDVTALTTVERIFCCLLMITGVVSYSMAISQITSIMTANDRRQEELKQKLDTLSGIRKEYQMSFDLYLRLRQSIHHHHLKDNKDTQHLMNELPGKLRLELSNVLYQHEVKGINYFKDKSAHFIASVAPLLKSFKIQKDEYVFLKGDPIDGIYFVKSGDAAFVTQQNQADLVFSAINQGTSFGESDFAILTDNQEATRQYTVKAMTEIQALMLDKQDLYNIDMEFKREIVELFENSKEEVNRLAQAKEQATFWLNQKHGNNNYRSESSQMSEITSEEEKIDEESQMGESSRQISDAELDQDSQVGDTDRKLLSSANYPSRNKQPDRYDRLRCEKNDSSLNMRSSPSSHSDVKLHSKENIGSYLKGQRAYQSQGTLCFSALLQNTPKTPSEFEVPPASQFKSLRRKGTAMSEHSKPDSRRKDQKILLKKTSIQQIQKNIKAFSIKSQNEVSQQMNELKDQFRRVGDLIKSLVDRNNLISRRNSVEVKTPIFQEDPKEEHPFERSPQGSKSPAFKKAQSSQNISKEARLSSYKIPLPQDSQMRQIRRGSSIESSFSYQILESHEKDSILTHKPSDRWCTKRSKKK